MLAWFLFIGAAGSQAAWDLTPSKTPCWQEGLLPTGNVPQVGSAARTVIVSSQGLPTVKANIAAVLGKRFGDAVQPFEAKCTPAVHIVGYACLFCRAAAPLTAAAWPKGWW